MTNTVDVILAEPSDRPLIDGLFQLYIHDFSEFQSAPSEQFEVDATGRFPPYFYLDHYWREEGRIPLLLKVDGRPAGFALINALAHSGGTLDRNMAEFFVLRRYRRGGVGAAAVATILRRYPGRWEIAIADRNAPARAFWPRVVGALDCVRDLKTIEMDDTHWRGPILQFVSVGEG